VLRSFIDICFPFSLLLINLFLCWTILHFIISRLIFPFLVIHYFFIVLSLDPPFLFLFLAVDHLRIRVLEVIAFYLLLLLHKVFHLKAEEENIHLFSVKDCLFVHHTQLSLSSFPIYIISFKKHVYFFISAFQNMTI
jgi:hypothetical protein